MKAIFVELFSSAEEVLMLANPNLISSDVLNVFSEEIAAHGGAVSETFHDHQRLFTRSVLPYMNDVRPHDSVGYAA